MGRKSNIVDGDCVVPIVRTVADREDVAPESLPPLYESVDPVQLERLLDTASVPVQITFVYCGYTVVVEPDGSIAVRESDDNVSDA